MLSVETKGAYPPMDRKFAAGLAAKRKVTPTEKRALIGKDANAFAKVYVEKVLDAWNKSRLRLSAEAADNYWGAAGRNERSER